MILHRHTNCPLRQKQYLIVKKNWKLKKNTLVQLNSLSDIFPEPSGKHINQYIFFFQ